MLSRLIRLTRTLVALSWAVLLIVLTALFFFNYHGPWASRLAKTVPLREQGCGSCNSCDR